MGDFSWDINIVWPFVNLIALFAYRISFPSPTELFDMKKDISTHGRVKIGYYYRRRDGKICYKKFRLYCSTFSNKDIKLYYCNRFNRNNLAMGDFSLDITIVWPFVNLIALFDYLISFTSPTELFFVIVFFLFH